MGRESEILCHVTHRYPALHAKDISLVHRGNHEIWRLECAEGPLCLRMVNSESYRRREWISPVEEFKALETLKGTGLVPRAYILDESYSPPFIIQEWVEGTLLNTVPLTDEHITKVGRAIADLGITSHDPLWLEKYRVDGYRYSVLSWYVRLTDAVRRSRNKEVARWALRIVRDVVRPTAYILRMDAAGVLRAYGEWTFHFDGAHSGNVCWRNGRPVFLDWDKVSYRNDPTYTLVRFATSATEHPADCTMLFKLADAFLARWDIPEFRAMAFYRWLERQTADLVWRLWNPTRAGNLPSFSAIEYCYASIRQLLPAYS